MNTTTNKLFNFIERRALLFLTLVSYLLLSAKMILFLAHPPKLVCGMPLLVAVSGQTFMRAIAFAVVSVIFYFGESYSWLEKIIIYPQVFIPIVIAVSLL